MPRVSIHLFGPFQTFLDGKALDNFKSDKARALLAYLAVEAEQPHSRARIAGYLWPEMPDKDALANLRFTLSSLRKTLREKESATPVLNASRESLQFNPLGTTWVDVTFFEQQLAYAAELPPLQALPYLTSAAQCYRGEFLDGFYLPGCPEFNDWIFLTRERLAIRALDVLHTLAEFYQSRGRWEQALAYACQSLELAPWDESLHQKVMRLLAQSGDASAALAQYRSCMRLLDETFQLPISSETVELAREIEAGKQAYFEPASAAAPAAGSPILCLGRDAELARLDEMLQRTLVGQGQTVFVRGSSGSGKSTLLAAFVNRALAEHPELLAAWGTCSDLSAAFALPLQPFRDILENLSGEFSSQRASGTFTPEYAQRVWNALPEIGQVLVTQGSGLIGTLLPPEGLSARLNAFTTPGAPWRQRLESLIRQREEAAPIPQDQQIDQITRLLQSLADLHPLVLVFDDLQWADPASLNLLYHLGQRLRNHRVLLLGAYRSFGAPDLLRRMARETQRHSGQPPLDLDQCDGRAFIEALLAQQGYAVTDDFRERLYRQTGGQALFTVDMLTTLQASQQLLRDAEGNWVASPSLNWSLIPDRVEAVLSGEYQRLPAEVRPLLEAASILDEQASARAIASLAGLDEGQVTRLLGALPGGDLAWLRTRMPVILHGELSQTFSFRHRLYQEFVLQQIPPERRAFLHGRAAQALAAIHAGDTGKIAAQIAYHYEQAGQVDAAIPFLLDAARYAARLSSFEQSIALLNHALEILPTLPPSAARDARELELLNVLSGQLLGGKGWASDERERIVQRAYELSQQAGEAAASQFLLTLYSLADLSRARGEHARSLAVGEQMMQLAQSGADQEYLALTHWTLGETYFYMGRLPEARRHLDEVVRLHDPLAERQLATITGADATVASLCWLSWIAAAEDRPAAARQLGEQAVELTRQLEHPFDRAFALTFGACGLFAFQGDWQRVFAPLETLMPLLQQDGLAPLLPWALVYQGWALARSGASDEGIPLIRAGIDAWRDAGAVSGVTCMRYYLADACLHAGDRAAAEQVIAETLRIIEQTDERLFEPRLRRMMAMV